MSRMTLFMHDLPLGAVPETSAVFAACRSEPQLIALAPHNSSYTHKCKSHDVQIISVCLQREYRWKTQALCQVKLICIILRRRTWRVCLSKFAEIVSRLNGPVRSFVGARKNRCKGIWVVSRGCRASEEECIIYVLFYVLDITVCFCLKMCF